MGMNQDTMAELLILYNIVSFSFPEDESEMMEEMIEKSTRLFGVSRLALVTFNGGRVKDIKSWGFQEDEDVLLISNQSKNSHSSFYYPLLQGDIGFLYMEQLRPISEGVKRLYTVFAKRIEEILRVKRIEDEQQILEKRNLQDQRDLLDSIPVQIWCLKEPDTYFMVNNAHAEFLGCDQNKIIGQKLNQVFTHKEDAKIMLGLNKKAFLQKKKVQEKIWIKNCQGEKRLFLLVLTPYFNKHQKLEYVMCSAKDITDFEQARIALQESEVKYRNLVERANDAIVIIQDGKLKYASTKMEEISGYKVEEMLETPFSNYVHFDNQPDDIDLFTCRRLQGQRSSIYEAIIVHRSGSSKYVEFSTDVILYEGRPADLVIIRDITERKRSEEHIRYLNYHDKLTGLYNRAFFEDELKRLDTPFRLPLSLILGDVNGLKLVNDAMGHEEGDRLLIKTARILKKACRKQDLIARFGGDEFAVLLPDTEEKDALAVCNRIKELCGEINCELIKPNIALGQATKIHMKQDFREVFKAAEDKMYRQKLIHSKSARNSLIISLQKSLSEKTHETQEHTRRLQVMARELGESMNLSDSMLDELLLLALLHDIGKIAIPDTILEKPGPLTVEEWHIMKKHTEIGYRIAVASQDLAHISIPILSHHERWDGKGYPQGLKKQEIPLISRIIAVIDAYDVMIHERPYKKAKTEQEAFHEIARCSGTQFDPYVAEMFVKVFTSRNVQECLRLQEA